MWATLRSQRIGLQSARYVDEWSAGWSAPSGVPINESHVKPIDYHRYGHDQATSHAHNWARAWVAAPGIHRFPWRRRVEDRRPLEHDRPPGWRERDGHPPRIAARSRPDDRPGESAARQRRAHGTALVAARTERSWPDRPGHLDRDGPPRERRGGAWHQGDPDDRQHPLLGLLRTRLGPAQVHAGRTGSGANAWPPRDPATYAALVAFLAQRYGERLAAIEVWNEPDQSNEAYFAGPNKPAALRRAAARGLPGDQAGRPEPCRCWRARSSAPTASS
jgi:hypothetical protein